MRNYEKIRNYQHNPFPIYACTCYFIIINMRAVTLYFSSSLHDLRAVAPYSSGPSCGTYSSWSLWDLGVVALYSLESLRTLRYVGSILLSESTELESCGPNYSECVQELRAVTPYSSGNLLDLRAVVSYSFESVRDLRAVAPHSSWSLQELRAVAPYFSGSLCYLRVVEGRSWQESMKL